MSEESVITRAASPGDINFIFSTWLKGLRYGCELYGSINSDIYFPVYHKVIQKVLSNSKVVVTIACLKTEPDVILGYMVTEGPKLHWCHVKSPWRGKGIAKHMLPKGINVVTHVTKAGSAILKKQPGWVFNPFLLLEG